MHACLEWLLRTARQFGRSRSGNVAILFGIASVPMVIGIGAAIDYSRLATFRTKLNNAADIATLGSISKDALPFKNTPTNAQVKKVFDQASAAVSGVTITNFQAIITSSATTMTVTVNYTASVPLLFGAFLGKSTASVSGTSTASINSPPYVNFYLLLDNSPSMGLGATANDISNLIALTAGQSATTWPNVQSGSIPRDSCAFACHQHTFDSSGNGHINGDDLNDNYHIAKANGVTLRIDVLRTATQQLTQTATSTATFSNQIGMAVYTFSDTFQTIAPLSTNMSNVASDAAAIDLAYAYWDQRDAQTSFDTALSYINGIMPNAGNGTSPASPQEFLFLVTDGVEDEPVGSASGAGDPADLPASYRPPNSQPNLANSQTGNVSANARLIDMIKADACTTIKNRGIKIAVLYTPYMPVTNNDFYNQWIGAIKTYLYNNNPVNPNDPTDPASNGVGQALKTCASPGLYYQVTPTAGIAEAMGVLFSKALTSVTLTN
jgi:Flp pilus assembly protein TadG